MATTAPGRTRTHISHRHGSQYVSVKFTESLALHSLSAFVGSVRDAYDNALAESIIGLFETEVINRYEPSRVGDRFFLEEDGLHHVEAISARGS